MPSISAPPLLATRDGGGNVVVAANVAIQFSGAVVVTELLPGITEVAVGGALPVLANNVWFTGGANPGPGTVNIVKVTTANDVQIGDVGSCVIAGGDCVQLNNGVGEPDLQFYNGGGNFVSFKADATQVVDTAYSWPPTAGLPGQVMILGLAGAMTWGTPAGTVSGNANTVAFFNGTGTIASAVAFQYFPLLNTMKIGSGTDSGTDCLSVGPEVRTNAGASGSICFGSSDSVGGIQISGTGSLVGGFKTDFGSSISDGGANGVLIVGRAQNGGVIQANADGSAAFGEADGTTASILSTAKGCLAFGYCTTGTAASISASSNGGLAFGHVTANGASITSNGVGCAAFGRVSDNGGAITAQGIANLAFGNPSTRQINTGAGNIGGIACGHPLTDRNTEALGRASYAFGDGVISSGDLSTGFGLSNTSSVFAGFILGRYGDISGTLAAWVSTEPVFAIGNGTSTVATANAFQIDKDGKVTQTAAQKNSAARSVNAGTSLSARTDFTLYVDTATAAGAVAVALPAGEQGLEFFIKDTGNEAAAKNISFTPNGGDLIESGATINVNNGCVHLRFFSGTWRIVSQALGNNWYKYSFNQADFAVAALSTDIEVFSLPAKGVIKGIVVRGTTEFTVFASYRVSIGIAGNLAKFASLFQLATPVTDTLNQATNIVAVENFVTATSIRIRAVANANLDTAVTGDVDVYVNWEVLP